jgi:hypothetical protein
LYPPPDYAPKASPELNLSGNYHHLAQQKAAGLRLAVATSAATIKIFLHFLPENRMSSLKTT